MFILSRIILLIILLLCGTAQAAPRLNFSDIDSGPKTGIGDGLGSGAIVTVWGNNLGSSQGTSKIYCNGVEAAHVYYWGNADGTSGPSDLYTYHKMQEISFSVGAGAETGSGTIYVEVAGQTSNTLDFTVRAGNIYHVKKEGSDTIGTGAWPSPWATISLNSAGIGNWSKLSAGDTVYMHDGVQEIDHYNDGTRVSGMKFSGVSGSSGNPISVIAYPGASVLARGQMYGINIWVPFVNISKIRVEGGNNSDGSTTGRSSGISPSRYARLVGNTITDRELSLGSETGCADGGNGAITANAANGSDNVSGIKVYGTHIYEWGCSNTHKFEHTTYMSNRSGQDIGTGTAVDVAPWEYGWNLLTDNKARGGIAAYDENLRDDGDGCGDITGTVKIHDNVIIDQVGYTIGWGTEMVSNATIDCWSNDVEIFNNLIINSGIGADGPDYTNDSTIFAFAGKGTTGMMKVYNNTVVGTGDELEATGNKGVLYIPASTLWGGTVEFKSNLIVDTDGIPFSAVGAGSDDTIAAGNNIFYDTGYLTAPAWDTAPIETDPLLDATYKPQTGSPAIDAGVSGLTTHDLNGTAWGEFDIGAFEYIHPGKRYRFAIDTPP